MKRILTLTLFAASIGFAYAQTPVVVQDAKTTAAELKIKCQVLKIAKNDCVIAHFSNTDDDWSLSKKPSDVYRVLNGKTADNLFVATDFHRNGQKQGDTFATPYATAVLKSWANSELQFNAKNYSNYRTDGTKEYTYDVVDGINNGTTTEYYENGSKKSSGAVKNDIHDGTWTYWYENGEKQSTGVEKDDLQIGKWMYWYDNGKDRTIEYFDDQGLLTNRAMAWYESGEKQAEIDYKAGERSGSSVYWHKNGQKSAEGNFLNDHEVGKWTFWHENSEKESQGKYVNGEYDGEWKFWDESGHRTEAMVYKNGELISNESNLASTAAVDAAKAAAYAAVDAARQIDNTYDAQAAADNLGVDCKKFIRADQCVIAYFDKNNDVQSSSKGAKYYRVLHGKVNDLYIIQDFYRTGQKQSNVVFASSSDGVLGSFSTFDLNPEGRVTGYKPNGATVFSDRFINGEIVYDATSAEAATPVDAVK